MMIRFKITRIEIQISLQYVWIIIDFDLVLRFRLKLANCDLAPKVEILYRFGFAPKNCEIWILCGCSVVWTLVVVLMLTLAVIITLRLKWHVYWMGTWRAQYTSSHSALRNNFLRMHNHISNQNFKFIINHWFHSAGEPNLCEHVSVLSTARTTTHHYFLRTYVYVHVSFLTTNGATYT